MYIRFLGWRQGDDPDGMGIEYDTDRMEGIPEYSADRDILFERACTIHSEGLRFDFQPHLD